MLTLEETRRAKTTDSALVASLTEATANTIRSPSNNGSAHSPPKNTNNTSKGKGKHRHNNRGKGSNGGSHTTSTNNGNGGGSRNQQSNSAPNGWTWVPLSPWHNQVQQGWTVPPCAYPTTSWTSGSSTPSARSHGILGPRSQQAFFAQANASGMHPGTFVPTDIAVVMQNLSLQQSDDNLYMDTGASSHMMSNNGSQDGDANYEKP
ncbi:hypothetical protein vseg_020947 [Gypsophila vaccaria]